MREWEEVDEIEEYDGSVRGWHPWIRGPISQQEALIVVGGYRCGTTSVFTHLAGHPEVNPCAIKEPAFFFSLRWREQPPVYPPHHEAETYLGMFRKRTGRVLLEATSNYLNDPGCADRIAAGLPQSRVIILLRDPVSRLVSWYKFLLLQGWLSPTVGFEQWVRDQMDDRSAVDVRPYHMQALEHGRYSRYIAEYQRAFGSARVLTIWFDDLQREPREVMQRICTFAGISPRFYDRYAFPAQNEAMKMKRPRAFAWYRAAHRRFFAAFRRFPRFQHRLKEILFGVIEPSILWLFTGPADPVEVPAQLKLELQRYYASDLTDLASVTGQSVPWQRDYAMAAGQGAAA